MLGLLRLCLNNANVALLQTLAGGKEGEKLTRKLDGSERGKRDRRRAEEKRGEGMGEMGAKWTERQESGRQKGYHHKLQY